MSRIHITLALVTALSAPLAAQTVPPGFSGAGASLTTGPAVVGSDRSAWAALGGLGVATVFEGGEIFLGSPDEVSFFPVPADGLGAVNVFGRDASDGEWLERASLRAADGEIGDAFGQALAVRGNHMVVGAPKKDAGRGVAYVFERSGSVWTEVARLSLEDAAPGDALGSSVAVDGDIALVGAPGRNEGTGVVAVFRREPLGAWELEATLAGEDVTGGDRFGSSVAVWADRAMVGAPGSLPSLMPGGGPPDIRPGSAHIFGRSHGEWSEEARFVGEGPSGLGWALLLLRDEAFVSAPMADRFVGFLQRYVLDDAGEWVEGGRLSPDDVQGAQLLGLYLARAGEHVVAGAPLAGSLGAAFVFAADATGAWRETQTLQGSQPFGFYGTSVAGDVGTILVGSPGSDFFEGVGHMYVLDDATGRWAEVDPIMADLESRPAVVGGTIECRDGATDEFACDEIDLVSYLPVSALGGGRGIIVNDVWGWTDPETGGEIALVGRNNGTAFVDLSDPENPVYLGDLPLTEGATVNMWRDMKVYANHAFIVSDGAGSHGIQIFDLTQLRDRSGIPRTYAETAHYDGIHSAHNIVINEDSGFAYVVGASMGGETCGGGLHTVDIRDPLNPSFVGCFADPTTGGSQTGYSHDAQCVSYHGPDLNYQGREICFGANETALSIADVTDKEAPVAVAAASYPNSAYLHQGWVSEDHRYFFMNDELDELSGLTNRTRTLVWDIQELDDPILVTEHLGSTSASDHNLYVKGDLMYQSNYLAGLQILDVSDPENPTEVGFFDTVPAGENGAGFAGSWSNYPFFESGVIVVTSMREGLFIVRKRPPPVS